MGAPCPSFPLTPRLYAHTWGEREEREASILFPPIFQLGWLRGCLVGDAGRSIIQRVGDQPGGGPIVVGGSPEGFRGGRMEGFLRRARAKRGHLRTVCLEKQISFFSSKEGKLRSLSSKNY